MVLRHLRHGSPPPTQEVRADFRAQHGRGGIALHSSSRTPALRSRSVQTMKPLTSKSCPAMPRARPAGHDSLKERLTSKIQTMREQRKAEERKQTAAKAQAWKQKQHEAGVLASKQKRCCPLLIAAAVCCLCLHEELWLDAERRCQVNARICFAACGPVLQPLAAHAKCVWN